MYKISSRVRYSETDEEEKLSITGILNYLQDCCVFHSEDVGIGSSWQHTHDRAWLLASWQIIIKERPALYEEITVGTQPYEFNRFFGKRNHWIWGKDGREYVTASSTWFMFSVSTGRVARITDDVSGAYELGEAAPMDYADRKITVPEGGEHLPSFAVRVEDLDSNHHVNNARYVTMAADCMPKGFIPAEIRAEYKKQAVLGTVVTPVRVLEGSTAVISLQGEDGQPYAVVEFRDALQAL